MLRVALMAGLAAPAISIGGCGPTYGELRRQGQRAMIQKAYGPARILFRQADEKSRGRVDNLHDLGTCSVILARQRFERKNHPAAMREVDEAIAYFTRAIDAYPGHQASIEGKTIALKLKGQFGLALEHVEWAAEFVGPSAKQYVLLAAELEERGDEDGAFLRFRQAVAIEPRSAAAHRAFAEFLLRNDNERMAVYHLKRAYRLNPRDQWVMDQLVARSALPPLALGEEPAP